MSAFIRNEKSVGEYVKKFPVTFSLMVACFIIFAIETILYNFISSEKLINFVDFMAIEKEGLLNGELWRILTAGITHGGAFHLFSNVVSIFLFSSFIEGKLNNTVKFLIFYLLSAVFVSISIAFLGDPAIGASGFVFACITYCYLYSIDKENNIHKSDKKMLLIMLGFNIVLTFIIPIISISGHISGLVIGAISYYIFKEKKDLTKNTEMENLI